MIDATPLLRLYARRRSRRLARQRAAREQERQLLRLVRRARATRFGRDHEFAAIADVPGFQRRVPLRRFEDSWEAYWRRDFPVLTDVTWPGTIPYFAVTSGTTSGRTKHIPLSRAMLAANRRAALDLYTHHLANRPRSRILAGRSFLLGGSTAAAALAPGVHSGDLSGIAPREMPRWARRRYFPPDAHRPHRGLGAQGRGHRQRPRARGHPRRQRHAELAADPVRPARRAPPRARPAPGRPFPRPGDAGPWRRQLRALPPPLRRSPRRERRRDARGLRRQRGLFRQRRPRRRRGDAADRGQRAVLRVRRNRRPGRPRPGPALARRRRDRRRLRHRRHQLRRPVGACRRRYRRLHRPRSAAPAGDRAHGLHAVGLRRASHRGGDRPGGGPGGGGDRRRRQRLFGGAGVPGGARRARRPCLCRRVRRRGARGRGARALRPGARPLPGAGQRRLRRPPRRRLRAARRPACTRWRRAPSPPG